MRRLALATLLLVIGACDSTPTSPGGDGGFNCHYTLSPTDVSPCMSVPSDLTVTIDTGATCPWTTAPDSSWITMTSPGSGTGPAIIKFRVADNWAPPRAGQVQVRWPASTAGQNVKVSQAGCYYAVSTTALSFSAGGGPGTFDVFQQSDPNTCGGALQNACVWSAQADTTWITVTNTGQRAGDDRVSFSVAQNSTGAPRTGTIAVRDKVVTITQAGS